jgi:rhodanese-related sulfurtransferase
MSDQIKHYESKLAYEIDSWDLFEALNNDESTVVIDARSEGAFEQEHIPGAINLPHRTIAPDTTWDLDRSAKYVTYCDGIGCNASTKGALNMARLGLDVRELIGGLDCWRRDGYATEGQKAAEGKEIQCDC